VGVDIVFLAVDVRICWGAYATTPFVYFIVF